MCLQAYWNHVFNRSNGSETKCLTCDSEPQATANSKRQRTASDSKQLDHYVSLIRRTHRRQISSSPLTPASSAMASRQPAAGSAEQPARSSTQPLASSSAEQPARNRAGQPAGSSAGQPASSNAAPPLSTSPCHTPDYPVLSISVLPSIGELHHHHEPIIAYHENKLLRPRALRPVRSLSAPPCRHGELRYFNSPPISRRREPRQFKAPPPLPPWRTSTNPSEYTFIYPPTLQNAIRTYDVSPYWTPPTVIVRMALTGDFVCTLGPEFSMLGVFHFGTVIYAERYVSSQLQRSVRVAYIGNTVAPDVEECIAEILAREHTNTIFVHPEPFV